MSGTGFGLTRLLRLPSFCVSYTVAVVAPLALLVWAFVDARFWDTAHTFLGIIRIESPRVETLAVAWRWHGFRLLIMASVTAISVLTAAIISGRLFIGTRQDRSLLSWMLAILLIGVWSGALLGVTRYSDAQLRYRLRRDLWRYRIVADVITSAGKVPSSAKTDFGEIRCSSFDTDRFPAAFLPNNRYSIHEQVQGIWTLDNGALLFTTYPSRVALEFHPRGTRPAQRYSTQKFGFNGILNMPLEELGDGWFLGRRHQP